MLNNNMRGRERERVRLKMKGLEATTTNIKLLINVINNNINIIMTNNDHQYE
jgi:hypothetical protein